MPLIFENNMANRKYAKSCNEPLGDAYLGIEGTEEEDHDVPTTPSNAIPSTVTDEQHGSSSATRPNKRAKTDNPEIDGLVGAFTSSSNRLATTIEKLAKGIWTFLMIYTI
jgi:hypothetical protein